MYDLIIIGAGPAGLTACLYALRFRLNVLILDRAALGGELASIYNLENYPGFPGHRSGTELVERMIEQLKELNFESKQAQVNSFKLDNQSAWCVSTDKQTYLTKTLIIATGSRPKNLQITGELEFKGKGVSYCAVCDAPFYKEKDVVVIGGGNKALEEAIYLTKFAKKVTLVHRRAEYRADKIIQERLSKNPKIKQILNSNVIEINGRNTVEAVVVENKNGEKQKILTQGVFIFIGVNPETGFMQNLIDKDAAGFLITDHNLSTNQKGIFACGDCRVNVLKQVVTACGEGAQAAYSVKKYLEAKEI